MIWNKARQLAKRYWICYIAGLAAVLGVKCFYSGAGSDALGWVLSPTAWWVRVLSGIPFEYVSGVGYVSHRFRFIIAASCSGVQFMIIAFAMLVFSYVHRMGTVKRGFAWIAFSALFSYLFTIFVNGFRILLSIYLPAWLGPEALSGWLTPERLHSAIGITIYFTSLALLYHGAGYAFGKILSPPAKSRTGFLAAGIRSFLSPLFWYFAIVLGIPFINRAYRNDGGRFWKYALLMTVVCMTVLCLFCLTAAIYRFIRRHGRIRRKAQ